MAKSKMPEKSRQRSLFREAMIRFLHNPTGMAGFIIISVMVILSLSAGIISGGMLQRIVIAIALACSLELLLADEPTTALDVTIQAQVLDMMNDIKKKMGTSVLMITHDLGIIAEMCDRVAVIYAGEIVEMGDLEHIFERTEHPYTRGLFDSLPNAVGEGNRLKPIEGLMPDPSNLPQGCKFSPRCPYATKECLEKPAPLTEVEPGHFVQCHHHGCMKKEKSRIEEGGDGNGRNQRK